MTHGPTKNEILIALPIIAAGAYGLVFHLRDLMSMLLSTAHVFRATGL